MATNPFSTSSAIAAMQQGITLVSPGSAHPPANPVVGMAYYNTATQCMMVWTGTSWAQVTSSKSWALFLDDDRDPDDADFDGDLLGPGTSVYVAKTVEYAQKLVEEMGLPVAISFDHDLGEGQPPATAFAWWLINGHLDELWDCKTICQVQVHSANPEGGRNIYLLWEGFCREHEIECKINRVKAIQK